jgi:hypothetical protein
VQEKENKQKGKTEPQSKKKVWRKLQKPKPRVAPRVEQPKDVRFYLIFEYFILFDPPFRFVSLAVF